MFCTTIGFSGFRMTSLRTSPLHLSLHSPPTRPYRYIQTLLPVVGFYDGVCALDVFLYIGFCTYIICTAVLRLNGFWSKNPLPPLTILHSNEKLGERILYRKTSVQYLSSIKMELPTYIFINGGF